MSDQYLEELSQKQGVDYRANVPAGTVLGEEQIEPGAAMKHTKSGSMLRAGDKALPEREPLYDLLRHDRSMVPATIVRARMARHPGRFTTIEPPDWHDSDPVPIEDTCDICLSDIERTQEQMDRFGSVERPRFYSESQLRTHYRLLHEQSWEDREADRRDRERREEQAQMRDLISTLAGALKPEAAEEIANIAAKKLTRKERE